MKNQTKLLCLILVLSILATLFVGCGDQKEDDSEARRKETKITSETAETTEPSEDPTEEPQDNPSEDPTEESQDNSEELLNVEGYGNNTVTALDSYAVLDAVPNDDNMALIVAINDKDESCLNNGELQIYYWIEFYNFMNSYGSYASMFGLDSNSPLDQQASMQEGSTWEQYFLEAAAKYYSENYALAQAAYADGYTMSEEDAASLADIDDPNGTMAQQAAEYGYASIDEYVQANFGKGVSVEDYKNYLRTYYAAYYCYTSYEEAYMQSISDADVEAYYDENAQTFEEQGLQKVNNIHVRHILIGIEGEQDENGEYSAEAWAAAEASANEIYQQWQTNPTEDYFAELAEEKSTDPGSNTNGGLYENVYPGQMVQTFNDWCFDASRAVGDSGIVKTDYGYHIMFFSGVSEERQWFTAAQEDMVSVEMNDFLDELIDLYPLKFDFTKVRIYDMITNAVAAE